MDLTDDFASSEDYLESIDNADSASDPLDGSSLSSNTSRSLSTFLWTESNGSSSSSSSGSEIRTLAAKPVPVSRPSTQFANVRHLASGYEPYPNEIPGRFPDMRLSQRTRKGHRKSRQGCFNCKKRKIKCQETLPACDNCIRKDLECTYPISKPPPSHDGYISQSSSFIPVQLSTEPIFSMADMRLFHHFMCAAYPHLPVGNETVWVGRIPAISHHYEFLMHAILGLAASHLTVTTRADYGSIALSHRVKAIRGFNEALSNTTRSGSDGDALLATVYALTFQSAYLSDGMRDFLTMMRGCALVSMQLVTEKVPMSFNVTIEEHHEFMKSRLHDLPLIAEEFVNGAEESLTAMSPLLTSDDGNKAAHTALMTCINAVREGGPPAYYKFIAIHSTFYSMDFQTFQDFLDPGNEVALILLAHFVSIELILSPIYAREWKGRQMSIPMNGIVDWVQKIQEELPTSQQHYLAWPTSIVALVKSEMKEKTIVPWLKDVMVKKW